MIESIYNSLFTLLDGLSTPSQVSKGESIVPTGYPCVTLAALQNSVNIGDEVNDIRTFSYRVHVYVNISKEHYGAEEGEVIMMRCVQEIMDAIEQDYSLSSTVINCVPSEVKFGYSDFGAGGLCRAATIQIDTTSCHFIN